MPQFVLSLGLLYDRGVSLQGNFHGSDWIHRRRLLPVTPMGLRLFLHSMAALALIASCGGDTTAPPSTTPSVKTDTTTHVVTTPTANVVMVENNDFSPANQTVSVGQSVTWQWDTCSSDPYGYGGATCVSHGVVFDDGTASEVQGSGSYNRTFAAKGTYPYHCPIHGSSMSGTITVQ
jgi:plastocyanin